MFDKKGSIVFDKKTVGEDQLMEAALEAGAEDVRDQGNEWEVITDPTTFEAVKKAIDQKGWKYLEARVGKIPQNTIQLEAGRAEQMLKLMEKLEDNDDVQNVYANFDIPDDVMEKLSQ
jgi:transcriptional/translational regulatory protein YebC/TACO1